MNYDNNRHWSYECEFDAGKYTYNVVGDISSAAEVTVTHPPLKPKSSGLKRKLILT